MRSYIDSSPQEKPRFRWFQYPYGWAWMPINLAAAKLQDKLNYPNNK